MSYCSAEGARKDMIPLWGIGLLSVLVLGVVGFLLLGRSSPFPAAGGISLLPSVNAFLNGTNAVLLITGLLFIRRRRARIHRAFMLTAFGVSCIFLISYLVYHYGVGSVPFRGKGWLRMVYFPLLISHVILAAMVVPLAMITIYRALIGQLDRHRRIARWTFPIWLYVSISGVVVYWMVYHL